MWSAFTVLSYPVAAGAIGGPTTVCPGSTQTYSISAVVNTTAIPGRLAEVLLRPIAAQPIRQM